MKYNRVLLKLSGEALSGKDNILDAEFLKETGIQIKRMLESLNNNQTANSRMF